MKTFLHLVQKLLFYTIILAAAKAREDPLTSNYTSPRGVEIYNPPQSFDPNGPWSMMARAGPTLYVAGMRGFHPSNNSLVSLVSSASSPSDAGYPRISQAFENMAQLARLGGSDIASCTRLVVYVNDMYRWRPAVNRVMEELWGVANGGIYPVRTIVEVQRLNDDDIVEVEGTFWVG